MDQNESENNEAQTKTSDAKNPLKSHESLRQSRPRDFSPRATNGHLISE